MLEVRYSARFKKDLKRCTKQGANLNELERVINTLRVPERLPEKNAPHKLKGNLAGWEECHVTPDLLLVYRYRDDGLDLFRVGSHSEILGL